MTRKIISAFHAMPPREVIDCRITGLRDVLRYHGVVMDSFTMFVLGQGIDFSFQQFKYKADNHMLLWWVEGASISWEEQLLANIAVPQRNYQFGNDQEGWSQLSGLIDQDIPVMVLLDSNYVHADRVARQSDRFYVGSVSVGPLVGYDMEGQLVYMDLKDDVSTALFSMAISDFMTARCSKCFPYSPDNQCYIIEVDSDCQNRLNAHMPELLKDALLKTCDYMLNYKGTENDAKGIYGMRLLAGAIEDFGGTLAQLDMDEGIINRLFVIKLKYMRQGMLPGSNTFYRDEFGKGIRRAADALKTQRLYKIGDGFVEMGKRWRDMIRLLAVAEYNIKDKHRYLRKLSQSLKAMADREEALFEGLRRNLSA